MSAVDANEKEAELIGKLSGDLRAIAEVVGLDAALSIGRHFKGSNIYIGRAKNLERVKRDAQIREEFDSGKPARRIALKYGLTERYVWKILGTGEGESSKEE